MAIENIIEEIKALNVMELADLVKAIEEEFGVSAAAPVAVAAVAGASWKINKTIVMMEKSNSLSA